MIQLNNMLEKLRKFVVRILVFFRVVDEHDNNLSITNIALLIALAKLAVTPTASLTDAGALIAGLSAYSYKKYLNLDLAQASLITNKIIKKSEDIASS